MSQIHLRCWVSLDGDRFFGPGRVELLEGIQTEGSISGAAKKMGMSYKKAWNMVNDLNNRGKHPFVLLKKGGEKGGGAYLTPYALDIIDQFKNLMDKLHRTVAGESGLLQKIR